MAERETEAEVTADALAALSTRLVGFCYQMLGSPFEAEDAVQDVMERAWRSRHTYDPARASLSTWCHRIAHNVCVDRLRGAARRPLPRDLHGPTAEIAGPLVPALDVPWLMPAPSACTATSDVATTTERAADVRLAVTAMLQTLPARQRGAFVLREVVGCSAAETAEVLGTTVPAVTSALQRARAGLGPTLDEVTRRRPLDPGLVERYARAIERADVPALAALVAADVVLEMPPVPDWTQGRRGYAAFMERLFAWRGTAWRTRSVSGNGQPGLLLYLVTAAGPVPHTVQLFDADPAADAADGVTGAIGHVLVYQDPALFALFERVSPAASRQD